MTSSQILDLAPCRFELLTDEPEFVGLGRVWIGDTLVRSGRLPLAPLTQTFRGGLKLAGLSVRGVEAGDQEIRIALDARFAPLDVKLLRDHSFDPIHEVGDWDEARIEGGGQLDLVLRLARDSFNGAAFAGFSYGWEYRSETTPLFYLLDRASWELDGDIEGATAFSQSSCSAPVAEFGADTEWTTEGVLFFETDQNANPVMTHNLPRWASHGAFDFQYKGGRTLIGVFERVELIRTVLRREAGKPELKCFDKHIFDEALEFATARKAILLRSGATSLTEQKNLWTWIHCEVEERARAEFGLLEEPFVPRISYNAWNNFTVDSYFRDLLPAAQAIGCREIFIDNLKKSAMTEDAPLPGVFQWNMCCGHEYEISDKLGGIERVRTFVEHCARAGVRAVSWTNNSQSLSSPINGSERDDKSWFLLLEDARQKYGGGYAGMMSIMDFSVPAVRDYFIESHLRIKQQTGLSSWLFDSFYNFGIMPISYRDTSPRTMWRGTLQLLKALQDGGVHFLIESFGPFGTPQHGHPSSYNLDTIFICYRVGLGSDYSTIPTQHALFKGHPDDAFATYFSLAHMAGADLPLFTDGKRIDEVWTDAHKRALADYHAAMGAMKTRFLQEDGLGVLWHDASGKRATLWNFQPRELALPGTIHDLSTGEALAQADHYALEACHTYAISDAKELPTRVGHS